MTRAGLALFLLKFWPTTAVSWSRWSAWLLGCVHGAACLCCWFNLLTHRIATAEVSMLGSSVCL